MTAFVILGLLSILFIIILLWPSGDIHDELPSVTRVEVIDENGRVYGRRPAKVAISVQDKGRTLKVFVSSRKERA